MPAKCPCGKPSRIIFFHQVLKKVVDFCWDCYDAAGGASNVGRS